MREQVFAARAQAGFHIVIRVGRRITGVAVADFEVNHVGTGPVNQLVAVARAGLEVRSSCQPIQQR